MRVDDLDRIGIAVASVVAAMVVYLVTCTAQAAPYTLRFRNPDPVTAYASLRTPWGTVAAPCAPGATCSVTIDLPIGSQAITAEATAAGSVWSPTSNAISVMIAPAPADCLALPACRYDADLSGSVTVSDFAAFLRSLGSSWLPAP